MDESRSKKSGRNIITGFGSKLLLMVLAFSTKTIFVRLLGAEYNGVNGLFSNILTVLSLADLGIGNVLTYTLYQALKDDDKSKITTMVHSFKKIYFWIAAAILGLGLLLVPLLPYIVNSSLPQGETTVYFLLYILNSAVSYFVVYKSTVITADQKYYITNIVSTASTAIMYVLQIIYLYFTHDFLGYLVIQVMCTIGMNVTLNIIANRMYPFLNDCTLIDSRKLSNGAIKENVKSTFIYKICVVLINNTDNILISIILGTIYVGYYSNYYMLIQYVNTFVSILSQGLVASLGNLNAEHNAQKSYTTFKSLGLMYGVIANFCCCCFACCIQGFIPIWIGKQYLLSKMEVASMLLVFYISTSIAPVWMFRETMGLFKEVKYVMLITMLINIGLSILLGNFIGLAGIILATSIAKLSTHYWYEPVILYKRNFNRKVITYFMTQLKYVICTVMSLTMALFISRFFPNSLIWLVLRVIICAVIVGLMELLFNFHTQEFKDLMGKAKCMLKCEL